MSSMRALPWCLFSRAGWAAPGEQEHLRHWAETLSGLISHLPGLPQTCHLLSPRNERFAASSGLGCTGKVRLPSQDSQPGDLSCPGSVVLWFCGSVTGTCVLQVELCVTYTHTNAHGQASLVVSVFHTLLCVYIYPHVPCIFIHMSLTDTHMEHGGE